MPWMASLFGLYIEEKIDSPDRKSTYQSFLKPLQLQSLEPPIPSNSITVERGQRSYTYLYVPRVQRRGSRPASFHTCDDEWD